MSDFLISPHGAICHESARPPGSPRRSPWAGVWGWVGISGKKGFWPWGEARGRWLCMPWRPEECVSSDILREQRGKPGHSVIS